MAEPIRRFQPSDLPELNRWLRALGLGEFARTDLLPPTGFFRPGGAAGFLYVTNTPGLAFISGVTPCPELPLPKRMLAMRGVVRRLLGLAREVGIRQVVTWTPNEHVALAGMKSFSFRPIESAIVMVALLKE